LGTITGTTIWQAPAYGAVPTVGARLYTDNTLTTYWNPATTSGYYLFQRSLDKYAVTVDAYGYINNVVYDCSGVPSVSLTPSVTPPVSLTPSLTPPVTPTYNSYYVEAHNCGLGCEYGSQFDTYAKFPSNYSAVVGKFYLQASGFQDYSYKIINSVDPSLGGTLCSTTPYDTCYAACGTTPPVSLTPSVTPPTTPCPSVSVSTPVNYDIFIMYEYGCLDGDCVDNGIEAYGAFTPGFSPNPTRYYRPTSGTGFAYKIGSIFQSGSPAILMNSTSYVSCPTAAQCTAPPAPE
jgi:hypothetical protein